MAKNISNKTADEIDRILAEMATKGVVTLYIENLGPVISIGQGRMKIKKNCVLDAWYIYKRHKKINARDSYGL